MIEYFFKITILEGVLFSIISSVMMICAIIFIKINIKIPQPKDELFTNNPPIKKL